MTRLSDSVFNYIGKQGVDRVFLLPGGGAMHLVDAVSKQSRIEYVPVHHEQAAGIAADAIDETKIADDGIDSEHYNDGSIDHAHLANDCVDGDNLADDAVNSEHYVDASIDHQHLANDCVDGDNIADNSVGLAALAGIARGKIIYGDASGDPALLAVGTNGQSLVSDGTDISWGDSAAGATGAGSDKIFWENGQTVTQNYTITDNYNAGTFGPVTINNSVTVTVGAGETWTIV